MRKLALEVCCLKAKGMEINLQAEAMAIMEPQDKAYWGHQQENFMDLGDKI